MLVFDGDCCFCTSVAHWAAARVQPGSVRLVPWQFTDLPTLGLTEAQVRQSVWVVHADGRLSGASACAWVLQHFSARAWRCLGVVLAAPVLNLATELLYRAIARNRHRMPGGTAACAINKL